MRSARKLGWMAFCLLSVTVTSIGCRREVETPTAPALTASDVRAERRAYDGAPPVIPHKSLGAACTTCHTETGKPVPSMAFAPANPHGAAGHFQNCRQCHLFKRGTDQFADSEFAGLKVEAKKGERLFAGAPPTIPHPTFMRSNCMACHGGPAARPEIRCTHPERILCQQCHVESNSLSEFVAVSPVADNAAHDVSE